MTKEELIKEITPLYNSYQEGRKTLAPVELIALMWDIGSTLEGYFNEHTIAPHALYREIYGKSEGTSNIKQRSYITREFLGRSYRVKRIFSSKDDLRMQLHGLSATNHFREAMPFFDNAKYILTPEEKKNFLETINGQLTNKKKEEYIKQLQTARIGVKNPRTQQLDRLSGDKATFITFYNEVYKALQLRDYAQAQTDLGFPDIGFIKKISLNCGALSADGLLMEPFEIPLNLSEKWLGFSKIVQKLITVSNPKERRRFRRLIPPEKMIRLSEMLDSFSSKEKYDRLNV